MRLALLGRLHMDSKASVFTDLVSYFACLALLDTKQTSLGLRCPRKDSKHAPKSAERP